MPAAGALLTGVFLVCVFLLVVQGPRIAGRAKQPKKTDEYDMSTTVENAAYGGDEGNSAYGADKSSYDMSGGRGLPPKKKNAGPYGGS